MYCINCGKEISGDSKVCPYCGTQVYWDDEDVNTTEASADVQGGQPEAQPEAVTYMQGGQPEAQPEAVTYMQGGQPEAQPEAVTYIQGGQTEAQPEAVTYIQGGQTEAAADGTDTPVGEVPGGNSGSVPKKKRGPGLVIAIAVIAALALIAVACVVGYRALDIPGMFGKSEKKAEFKGVYYIKDNELKFSGFPCREAAGIDDDIYDDWTDENEYHSARLTLSDDGKYLYYGADIDSSDYTSGYELYRTAASGRGEPVRIAKNVRSYDPAGGSRVLYLDTSGSLYLYDDKGDTRLSRNVSYYLTDENNRYAVWIDDDGDMYYQSLDLKKDKEKLDRDVDEICDVSGNLHDILYTRYEDGKLDVYLIRDLGEEVKIVNNADIVKAYIRDGHPLVFYTKNTYDAGVTFYDLIEDDHPEDDRMTEPDIEDYTTKTRVMTDYGMVEREEVDDKYYEDLKKYGKKLERDDARQEYMHRSLGINKTTLYCSFADGEDVKLGSGPIEINRVPNDIINGDDVLVFSYYDLSKVRKIKLSDMMNRQNDGIDIEEAFYEAAQIKVARGKVCADAVFGDAPVRMANMYPGENSLYAHVFYKGNTEEGDLYSVSIQNDDLGATSKIDTDVTFVTGVLDDSVYYIVDYDQDDQEGDLYCDGNRIDEDVYAYGSVQKAETGYLYFKNYDIPDRCADLYLYKGGKSIRIDQEVYECYPCSDRYIAFLTDYDTRDHMGDLKVYNGKECVKVDSDVNTIVYY